MSRCIAMVLLMLVSSVPEAVSAPLGVRTGVTVEGAPVLDGDTWSIIFSMRTDDGAPLPLGALSVAVAAGSPHAVVTDATGRVRVPIDKSAAKAGRVAWNARFSGTALHAAGEFKGIADLSRVPVILRILAPTDPIGLDTGPAGTRITLESLGASAAPLADTVIRVRIDDGPFQFARTGPRGDLEFVLRPELLVATDPSAGPVTVDAVFDGDAAFAPAESRASIPRRILSRVTLRVAREGDAATGRLRFSGRASHELGSYANAIVRLGIDDDTGTPRLDLPALAGPDGIWNASVSLDELRALGVERISVRAHVAPTLGVVAAKSGSLRLEVPRAPGRSILWPALGLIAVLIAVRLFNAATRAAIKRAIAAIPDHLAKAWRVVAARFTRHRRQDAEDTSEPALDALGGLERVRRRAGEPGGRRDVIALSIRDRDDGRSLSVTARLVDPANAVVASREGAAFEIQMPDGTVGTLELAAPGLFPIAIAVAFPHDGGLDGAVVRMRRVERRIRELHEAAARRHGEDPRWGQNTPREVEGRVAARLMHPESEVSAAVASVELAYFGSAPASPADAEALEARLSGNTTDAAEGT